MKSAPNPVFICMMGTGGDEVAVYEAPGSLFTPSQYFWKYLDVPKAHGPFRSIPELTFHYEMFLGAKKAHATNDKYRENVIYVDFKNKKRIG